jgi:hypothetical protein
LHDVCGSILLFHGAYRRLPHSLAELQRATGLRQRQITDPVSNKPFLYAPGGLAVSAKGPRIVAVAAPAPAARTGWAVSVRHEEGTLRAEVVALPASAFEKMQAGLDADRPAVAPGNNGAP